jgi:hypothetical protein
LNPVDPVIDEQASLSGIEDIAPDLPPEEWPWRESEHLPPQDAGDDWQAEVTGMAGSGMPEAPSQAENPGTNTDILVPPPKKRIDLDRV